MPAKTVKTKQAYIQGIGRRKTAVASVRLSLLKNKKEVQFLINDRPLLEYFRLEKLQKMAEEPLKKIKMPEHFAVLIKVKGGGISSQAEAVRLGLSRALEKFNPELRPELKKLGFLTRNPQRKERKKPGLRGARRAQQWSKR